MLRTKFIRQSVVDMYLADAEPAATPVSILRLALQSLQSAPIGTDEKTYLLMDTGKRVAVDLRYEKSELIKDLLLLEDGEDALFAYLISQNGPGFEEKVAEGVVFLGDTLFHNFVTARNGTVSPDCPRCVTAIQSVYNAIWLTMWAKTCTVNSSFITSKSLAWIRATSVMPDGIVNYGASSGKECMGHQGVYYSQSASSSDADVMRRYSLAASHFEACSVYQNP